MRIATQGIGAHGHGTINPISHLWRVAAQQVAAKIGWNLQRQTDAALAHALLQIGMTDQRRSLNKVARAREVLYVALAVGGAVVVEHREGEIFHIQIDAIAHDEHQKNRPQQRQQAADRITTQFNRLAPGIAHQPAQAETRQPCR